MVPRKLHRLRRFMLISFGMEEEKKDFSQKYSAGIYFGLQIAQLGPITKPKT